ncbi:polyketide cyclase [Porphyromonas macacae]|uniref:Polyketide cyclase n=1 Tax=Porphyromonas macacae TaxID=28115 RepID=A0A379DLA9_9PORP|nr:SRPBCC family protein [Porphyromonas macacae]KGN99669.1 polyketide cyclase [Porphyromonas macacae]SUB78565.1 Uncharacterised protein [Porphyromonas macacae]
MTEYISEIKQIAASRPLVFSVLSDLNNVKSLSDKIPADYKLQIEPVDADNMAIMVPGAGRMQLRIVEREADQTIKLETVNFPVKANAWIQLLEPAENDTRLRLTLKADLNLLIRNMVGGKLKDMVDQMASMLSLIPYEQFK